MEIIHNNVIIADQVRYYDDFFAKSKGLRFSKKIKPGEAVVLAANEESQIETMIDMLFVFFSIDVIWLNQNKEVVDVRRTVRPFTPIIFPRKAAMYVVELPNGMAKNIKIGEKINFGITE